ncbi:MAG: hypothetical protein H6700_02985 [Myxococcales bacterium]|nr:hypothetical protein [Myxococcales bacterium]
MAELAVIFAVAAALVGLGGLALVPWAPLLKVGGAIVAVGIGFGVPAGVVYHVLLYRALAPRGALPPRWLWNPLALHDRLRAGERRAVLAWCYSGGAGFVLIVLGALLCAVAAVHAAVEG